MFRLFLRFIDPYFPAGNFSTSFVLDVPAREFAYALALPSAYSFLKIATPRPSLLETDVRRLGVADVDGLGDTSDVDIIDDATVNVPVLKHMKWKVRCFPSFSSFVTEPM